MTARFVRVSWGLEYTEAFLEIGKIKSYIQSFQNGREVDDTTKMSESIAWNAQNRMEEEILQTIRTCDTLTKEELFDYLTGWIEYFERNVNSNYSIVQKIKEYNNKRLIEYEKFILEEEKKFRSTKEYKTLNHLDFYEVESNWTNSKIVNIFIIKI